MKKIAFSVPVTIALLFLFSFFACKKTDKPGAVNSFTWTFNSTNYTANFNGAYISSMSVTGPIIVGGTGNSFTAHGTGPSITLPSLSVGTYSFSSGTNDKIHYIDDAGFVLESIDGSINITENSNNQLSGNFSATLIDASIVSHHIDGSFTRVPIEQ